MKGVRYGLDQKQEMELAYKSKRQPICIHCQHPLNKVAESQDEEIVWTYDKKLKIYEKRTDGIGEKPYHDCNRCGNGCAAEDWDFIDYRLINF
ncbi:MAG: hypothetical protein AB1753_08280 [Thermoproteota archaeon]